MIKVESVCPYCSKVNKFSFAGSSGTMRKLNCSNCTKPWEEAFEEDFTHTLGKSARSSGEVIEVLEDRHELHKMVADDIEIARNIAEFSTSQMRQWGPDMKLQVGNWAKAAVPRFKESSTESDAALFTKFVDGMLTAMNGTADTDKSDPVSLIKQIQSGHSGERFGREGIFGMEKTSSADAAPANDLIKAIADAQRRPISGREFLR